MLNIVLDGCNIAKATGDRKTRMRLLLKMIEKLRQYGRVVTFVSAKFKHEVDERKKFDKMVEDGSIVQAPAGCDDDEYFLDYARKKNSFVVSNDCFKEFIPIYGKIIRERRLPFMFVPEEDGSYTLITPWDKRFKRVKV